jgi:hypothetical protein
MIRLDYTNSKFTTQGRGGISPSSKMRQPLPQLFPPPQGKDVTAEQVANSLAATVNELQRWFTRTTPRIIDDIVFPKTERQDIEADFVIEPNCFNIELVADAAVTCNATQGIADGEHGQLILIENVSEFVVTILDGAMTRLAGSLDFAMDPHSTLLLKWNGLEWVEVARSQN